jgi:hypothetical protein
MKIEKYMKKSRAADFFLIYEVKASQRGKDAVI